MATKMVNHLETQVVGLDTLLRGGLVSPPSGQGLVVLIKGQPGTGKTTLALQIAGSAYQWDTGWEGVRVCSCEQTKKDIEATLERLNPDAASQISIDIPGSEGGTTDLESPLDSEWSPFIWASELISKLDDSARVVVVDGLNTLPAEQRRLVSVESLMSSLRRKALVSILVYEPASQDLGGIDFQADMVIELRGEELRGPPKYYLNHLCIVKSRFQQSALGWHQYKIRKNGIHVFPSLHFRIHRPGLLQDQFKQSLVAIARQNREDQRKSHPADRAILTHLLGAGNLKRGSCTVVLGPRRTWKTQVTLDFLRAGSRQGEAGLLLSLLDNQGTIIQQVPTLCEKYCLHKRKCKNQTRCYSRFFLFHFRPGCLAPGEFFHFLERRLEDGEEQGMPIRRLTFWDLTQLQSRFPLLANDRMFLAGLMDFLKHSEVPDTHKKRLVTSVFMGAPNMDLAKAASAMADNVLFCWQDKHEKRGEGIAFYVDRIEGQPGQKQLSFLRGFKGPVHNLGEILKPCKEDDLTRGKSWIDGIRNLQGLPVRRED